MDGRRCQKKDHGDTVPKKPRDKFLCTQKINIKKCTKIGLVMRDKCGLPQQN